MAKEKIESVFLGKIVEESYSFNNGQYWGHDDSYYCKPYLSAGSKIIKYEKIAESDIEKPPFEKNEEIYLSDLKKHVTIEKVTRGTDGTITYTTNYIIKTINKEKSKELQKQLDDELIKYTEWLELQKEQDSKKHEEQKPKYTNLYLAQVLGLITKEQANIITQLQEDNNFISALTELHKLDK
jgi:hypothetical protein